MRKKENKSYRFVSFLLDAEQKMAKKKQKKIKKIKKILLWLHFQAKQVGKGLEREKIKIIVPFRSYQKRNKNFQKNSKKIQKIKIYHSGIISSQNRLEKDEKGRK